MLVSISISAYNEEKYLPALFESLVHQTYPHKQIEIILMNAMSTDHTRSLMNEFQETYQQEFYAIKIFDNPKKTSNIGLNIGFRHSDGECYLKIDAHSLIPENFVERNVAVIKSGQMVCGGRRPTLVESDDEFSKTLHIVEESSLGSSIANYRKGDQSRYVDSIFHGMYHKDVIAKAGYVDEQLVRTEDNEFHYRIRKNGFKIWYDTSIESFQYIRPTFNKMLKQKFGNGYWIGLTSHVCRECLSLFHFVPGIFVSTLLTTILITGISALPFFFLVSVYLLAIISLSIFEILTHPFHITRLLIPFMIISIHISYGVGTIRGWIEGFWWKKTYFSNNEQ